MTKSDHELIKFAAGKLNVEVHVGAAYDEKKIWYEAPTAICAINIHHHNGTPFDLTSPELFLKGLEVLPDYISWDIDGDKSEQYVNLVDLRKGDTNAARFWKTPKEIPLLFWQCYYELEGGKG